MEKPYTPGVQLLILFGLTYLFQLVAQVFFHFIFSGYTSNVGLEDDPWVFLGWGLIVQVFTHIFTFFVFIKVTDSSFNQLIDHEKLAWKKLILIPIVVVAAIFVVNFFTIISTGIFESLQAYSYLEDEYAKNAKLEGYLTHQEPLRLVYSIFVIGIVTSIGEELVYRGVLLKKLFEATYNKHFAVLISAIIFAAMHGHPVQILPIAVMGVAFGYIYLYTRNIWYTVIIHCLFNAIQIIGIYFWPEAIV